MLKLETTEIPAGLEQYYEASGNGQFRLKVEGAVSATEAEGTKSKLKEFRDSNIELKKKVEELSRFEAMFKSGEFSADKLNSKIEEQALLKAAEMKAAYEDQLREANEQLGTVSSRFEQMVIDTEVSKAALKHGVSETALEDVFARAKAAFGVVDGALTAKDGVLDAKGNKYTVESWMANLAEKAPHLFKASSGASAFQTQKARPRTDAPSAVDLISAGLASRK